MHGNYRKLQCSLLLVASLASCSATGPLIASPSIELSGVSVSRIGFDSQTFLLSFHVSNPNPFPLPVQSVRYQVQLAEQRFASGETSGKFKIPASGEGAFDISVDLDLLRQSNGLSSILRAGANQTLDYELTGSLGVDLPLVKSLPFSSTGVITIASR